MNHVPPRTTAANRRLLSRVSGPVILTGLVTGAAFIAACQDSTPSESPVPPLTLESMQEYVTGNAAANLTSTGRFKRQLPPKDDTSQITGEQAVALATIWPRQFGPWLHQHLESQHGGPIDLNGLTPCGDPMYAASPYSPMAAALAAKPEVQAARRVYGPWWVVSLCSRGGTPKVSVAVAAYSTDLQIEKGAIRFPTVGGEWFSVEGIPSLTGGDFLEGPERLVQRVAGLTGSRVSEVPELMIPDRKDGFPNHARWRVSLEHPAAGRTASGHQVTQAELYSWRRPGAPGLGFQISSASQPEGVTFRYPTDLATTPPSQPLPYAEGFLKRRSNVPVSFEPVSLTGGN